MNTIKFRICYTAQNGEKRIIYEDNRYLIGLDGQVYENYGNDWKTPMWEVPFDVASPPILQRFTGCHDKNKKEIYEGDKLEYNIPGHSKFQGVAQFFAGNFVCDWGDQTEEPLSYMRTDDLEVVGNIFEV
jgi:hypothetical protein